jgi:G3E family GTPase
MPRPLPVTLVAGFLGAGKTSLLHHLVTEHTGGHLALLVEKTGELGVDACALRGLGGAMGRSNDRVDEFSTAGQFQALLREIAQDGRQERVLVEVDGLTQASYWARLLREDQVGGATVEQIVVVVDLLDFHRGAVASDSNPAARALRDFSCAPIAGATLLVLNKCDLLGDDERAAATRQLRAMNPDARIIETAYGEIPPAEILRPAPAGLVSAVLNSTASQEDFPPETPVFESVVYRAFRPFHPQRFWDWFEASHPGLLRVKGLVWLATRNLLVGGVSRTAWQNGCGAAGVWWAALPREEWPSEPEALMEMQQNWREPYGDRRQELVLVGARGPTADAARKLNLCLLSDAEFALPDWRGLPDPFPVWDLDAEG